ncbi:LysR family transcriptional regulator [Georgenia sp. Z1344]|uniref:LysR family transcriptional regulator n=1 Tax=Georgenia sp. Z1344 TaxID=3416706 RepID=UPI003CFA130A
MELRQLKYFTCLVREGTVTRAAQRLGIVQPALSAQIAKLEHELGHDLFERTPRGMVPTLEGRRAYNTFAPLLDQFDAARELVSTPVSAETEVLRIGVISGATDRALLGAVEAFVPDHPHVLLQIVPGFSADLVTRLRAGEFDTVIINESFRYDGLVGRELVDEELCLVAGEGAPPPVADPIPLPWLASAPLVVPSGRHGLRRIVDSVLGPRGLALRPLIEIDDLGLILDLIEKLPLCGILPLSRINADSGVRRYRLTPPIMRRIVGVRDPARPPTDAENEFVDLLATSLRRLGGSESDATGEAHTSSD